MTILIGLLFICQSLFAADWVNWRGPNYNGTSEETGLPDKLDPEGNLAWSVHLPGEASSTPVIAVGKVFLTSTDKDSQDLLALCLDAQTGTVLWKQIISEASEKIPLNTLASCSPAAGPDRIYFLYAEGTAICLDHAGKEIWKRNLVEEYGPLALKFGYSSSPLLYNGNLYILVLRRDRSYRGPEKTGLDSYLIALDGQTGKTIFRQSRPTDALDETTNSYTTPLPAKLGDQVQILVYGADYLTGHDPETGQELWRYPYDTTKDKMNRVVPTPLAENGIVYCASSRGKRLFAFDIKKFMEKENPLLWEIEYAGPDVACPVLYKGSLYVLDDREEKMLSCLDPVTGKVRWKGQVDKSGVYYTSPTAADDKLYLINEKGILSIVAVNPAEFRILSTLVLGQGPIRSSIAIAGGKIYVRTTETLYCFGR
jgi:outer membrane protein assembly factor BamB